MKKYSILVAVFLFSCTSKIESPDSILQGNADGGICLSGGTACYEGLTEAMCKTLETSEWEKVGNCPSDWTRCPGEGDIMSYFRPDLISTCPDEGSSSSMASRSSAMPSSSSRASSSSGAVAYQVLSNLDFSGGVLAPWQKSFGDLPASNKQGKI
jgi:hypothetical protein